MRSAGWRDRGVEHICTTLEERDGTLTGHLVSGDCFGAEKARRIRERIDLTRYAVIYAYGDTIEDREMLDLADKSITVGSWRVESAELKVDS